MIIRRLIPLLAVVGFLLGLIALLQYQLWLGSAGIFSTNQLEQQVINLRDNVTQLEKRNQKLYDEVVSLRNNNDVIEGLARENFGYIEQGETFYIPVSQKD